MMRSVSKLTPQIVTTGKISPFPLHSCQGARAAEMEHKCVFVFICLCMCGGFLFWLCSCLSGFVILVSFECCVHMNMSWCVYAYFSLATALVSPSKSRLMPPHSDYLSHPFKALAGGKVNNMKTHNKLVLRTRKEPGGSKRVFICRIVCVVFTGSVTQVIDPFIHTVAENMFMLLWSLCSSLSPPYLFKSHFTQHLYISLLLKCPWSL